MRPYGMHGKADYQIGLPKLTFAGLLIEKRFGPEAGAIN